MLKIIKIYKDDCSNCEDMLPVFESFKIKYPNFKYEEIDGTVEVEKKQIYAPRVPWKYPLICFIENEKTLLYTSGVVSLEQLEANLSLALKDVSALKELKEQVRDAIDNMEINIIKQQRDIVGMKQNVQALTGIISVKSEPKAVPDLPVDPSEETSCDSCQ